MLKKPSQLNSLPKSPSGFVYQRHKPEETELYKIIENNLPAFQSHLSNADTSLPSFVHDEFSKYLRCGLLEHGFSAFHGPYVYFSLDNPTHLADALPSLSAQSKQTSSKKFLIILRRNHHRLNPLLQSVTTKQRGLAVKVSLLGLKIFSVINPIACTPAD